MNRQLLHAAVLACSVLYTTLCTAQGLDLTALSNRDAVSALRTALSQGANKAVDDLGRLDGFLGNPEVKIPLPPRLKKAERRLRRFGFGPQADQLVTAMNRAAERAVPEAKVLLVDAVKSMTLADAKAILTGGDDAATRYFQARTQETLALKFRPIVAEATAQVGLARTYNSFAGVAAQFGLIDSGDANLDDYVTARALDGLFKMIAAEELAIRRDPIGQSSRLLRRVFALVMQPSS